MKQIIASHHVIVAAAAAALLIERDAGRMLGAPGRRRSGRRGRAHRRHHRPGCDDRRRRCDRLGWRGAGTHHGHDHGAHPGAGARGPRVARRSGPRRPDAHRARRRRSRRRRPCRARSGPCRRTGVEGGRSRAPGRGSWPRARTRVARSHRRPAGQAIRHRAGTR